MKKVNLFDFEFISVDSIIETADAIMAYDDKFSCIVITPNAYIIQLLHKSEYTDILAFARQAAFVLPDGIPIVWLSKLLYGAKGLKTRLTGSDLFPVIWRKIIAGGKRVSFVVANNHLGELFKKEYPEACNFIVPDIFDPNDKKYLQKIVSQIRNIILQNQSEYVFIGISDPKQTMICMHLTNLLKKETIQTPCKILLLGASFEFYHGMVPRANKIIQKAGMEWLFRFMLEPRRLWKRYTIENLKFIKLCIKEIFKKKY